MNKEFLFCKMFGLRCCVLLITIGVAIYFCTPFIDASSSSTSSTSLPLNTIPLYIYRIIHTYPHDRNAFTQGLFFNDGFLYEGTGLYGRSSLRKIELETGSIVKIYNLPPQFFGEGVTIFKEKIIQLTWKSREGFVYDKESFNLLQRFNYPTEGWGITNNGSLLIMSDGTSLLRFLDPMTFTQVNQIEVHDREVPVTKLNELEYIKGEIYANVWPTARIAKISPRTGQVNGWIELKGLFEQSGYQDSVDVLNGIAYDEKTHRLFVTGKLWPQLFEIELLKVK